MNNEEIINEEIEYNTHPTCECCDRKLMDVEVVLNLLIDGVKGLNKIGYIDATMESIMENKVHVAAFRMLLEFRAGENLYVDKAIDKIIKNLPKVN